MEVARSLAEQNTSTATHSYFRKRSPVMEKWLISWFSLMGNRKKVIEVAHLCPTSWALGKEKYHTKNVPEILLAYDAQGHWCILL